jgi:ABC-type transport system involved in multi-copper enzyme maturation permease subunit
MSELLRANLKVHLIYYRRSRLVTGFALVFLLLVLLFSLPAVFSSSVVETFGALQSIFTMLNDLLIAFSAGLGLFIISSHLRDRNLKMVFTKPCPPPVWLASAFLSAVVASLILNVAILVGALAVSLIWHAKVEPGLVYLSLVTFAASVGMIAYMMFLATILHPVIAAVFALLFNPDLFYNIQIWTQVMINGGMKNWALQALTRLFHFIYLALPMIHAYPKQTDAVSGALRVGHGQWPTAFYSLGYALALSALSYCLSLFFLQRKRLI